MVVDIVRTCQSTVARNFHLMVAPNPSADDQTATTTQPTASIEAALQSQKESNHALFDNTRGSSSAFFREPPHLNAEVGSSFSGPINSVGKSQDTNSDSGYSSLPCSCRCSCHYLYESWDIADCKELSSCFLRLQLTNNKVRSNCRSCADKHINLDDLNGLDELDLSDLYNDFDAYNDGIEPEVQFGMDGLDQDTAKTLTLFQHQWSVQSSSRID